MADLPGDEGLDLVGKVRLDTSQLQFALAEVRGALTGIGRGITFTGVAAGLGAVAQQALSLTAALIPAVGVLGAIPGVIAIASASIATLLIGTKGVGDALSAVATGDVEKLKEAMKGLAPNAQAFVRAVGQVRGEFTKLRKDVQNDLFAGFDKSLTQLARASLPTLRAGLSQTADSINLVARNAAGAMSTPLFQGRLSAVFTTSARTTDMFAKSIGPLIQALAAAAEAAGPTIERFTEWITTLIIAKGEFLATEEGVDAMSGAISRGADVLATIGRTLFALGAGINNVLQSAANPTMLQTIEQMAVAFREWSASAQGQEDLALIFGTLQRISENMAVIIPVLAQAFLLLFEAIDSLPGPLQEGVLQLAALGIVIGPLVSNLGGFVGVLAGIGGGISGLIGRFTTWRQVSLEAAEAHAKTAEKLGDLRNQADGLERAKLQTTLLGDKDATKALGDELDRVNKEIDKLQTKNPKLKLDTTAGNDAGSKTATGFASGFAGGIGGAIASSGALTAIRTAVVGLVGGALAAVAAFFGLPVWAVVAIGAGLALAGGLIWSFRDEIANFFTSTLPSFLGDAVSAAGDFGGYLLDKGRDLITGLWNGAQEAWASVTEFFVQLPSNIAYSLGFVAGTLYRHGVDLITGLWNGAVDTWNFVVKFFTDIVPRALSALGDTAKSLYGKGVDLLQGLWNGVTDIWNINFKFWSELPGKAVALIGEVARTLYDKGRSLLQGLWDGIRERWERDGPLGFFLGLGGDALRLIGNVARTLYNKGLDLLQGLWEGIVDRYRSVAEWFAGLNGNILGTIGSTIGWLKQAGIDILQGLLNGISEMYDKVVGKMKSLGGDIIKGFKDAAGIKSPSRLMAEAGRFLMDGLTLGIDEASGSAVRKVSDLATQLAGLMKVSPSKLGLVQAEDGSWVTPSFYGGSNAGVAAAIADSFSFEINFNGPVADRQSVTAGASDLIEAIKAGVGARRGN